MPNNYILLDRIELNDTAASVTFDNIPQSGYTDLKLVVSARSNRSASTADNIRMQFNNDTGSVYSLRYIEGNGASASSAATGTTTSLLIAYTNAAGSTSNTFDNTEIYIPNYRSSTAKSTSTDNVVETNATTAFTVLAAGLWNPATQASINSIKLFPQVGTAFVANSTFSLYGLAQVGTTPAIAPKADGGNVIGTDGTYWYHAFLSNGTFTPQVGLTADVLVIAGGGAGGIGGGGAGGVAYYSSQVLTTTSFACTVGAGGAALANNVTAGSKGVNSTFGGLAAAIGGGSGDLNDNAYTASGFLNGGSGGGGGGSGTVTTNGGTGTSGQGNRGFGNGGNIGANFAGGGGGGAGAAGSAAPNTNTGGNGGVGTSAYSSWGIATSTGQNVSGTRFYAGGGGGGGNGVTNFGVGGSGGGGNASNVPVASGTINTGGGGGGYNGGVNAGGNGGSGIVIVRYLVA